MVNPILTKKIFIPTSRPNTVFRSSLIQKITEGLAQGGKLTLVSAPAGYGKTTLIIEWLKTLDREYAWISMDAGDNALVALAQDQRNIGNLSESNEAFREALKISIHEGYSLTVCTVSMDLVYNYYFQGNLQEAMQLCLDTLGESTGNKPLPEAGILNIPLSLFYYETNRLKLAEETVHKGIDACRRMAISKIFGGDAERNLARIKYLLGSPEEALTILQEGLKGAKVSGLPIAALRFEAIQADLMLKMGKVQWVEEWIKRSGLSLEGEITSLREQPYLVYVRFLLAQQHWAKAQALLAKLEEFARDQRKGRLISARWRYSHVL